MTKKLNNKDYESLGRMLVSVAENGYLDRTRMLKMSFLKGVATGLGGVLGATLVVAILLWVLSLFDQIPLIGPIVDRFNETVRSSQ